MIFGTGFDFVSCPSRESPPIRAVTGGTKDVSNYFNFEKNVVLHLLHVYVTKKGLRAVCDQPWCSLPNLPDLRLLGAKENRNHWDRRCVILRRTTRITPSSAYWCSIEKTLQG